MTKEQQELYNEGYKSFIFGYSYECNPYSGSNADYWADGWEDAQDDEAQL